MNLPQVRSVFQIIIFLATAHMLGAQGDIQNTIIQASEAIKSQDTQLAIEKYESLPQHGSVDIYYNLGRLYQELDNHAKAVLNYERALRIQNNHEACLNNLAIIREDTDIDIIPVEKMFLIQWWDRLSSVLSSNVWMVLSMLMALVWIVAIYFWWISKESKFRRQAFLTAVIAPLIIAVTLALGSNAHSLETNQDYAIIMNDDYDMHEGADERSPINKDLRAGNKVEIIDQINDWYKVETADTESGWVKIDEVERI